MAGADDHRDLGGKRLGARLAWAFGKGPDLCRACEARPDDRRLCRGCPQRGDPASGRPSFLPRIPEEVEAFAILWPLPPLRMGPTRPIGLDLAEVRARVRVGFDADLVVALARAAEPDVMAHLLKEAGPRND